MRWILSSFKGKNPSLYRIYLIFKTKETLKTSCLMSKYIFFCSPNDRLLYPHPITKQAHLYSPCQKNYSYHLYSGTRYISTHPIRIQHELSAHPGGKKWDWYLFTQRKIDWSLYSRSNKTDWYLLSFYKIRSKLLTSTGFSWKKFFYLHIFVRWPPLKKISRVCKIKVFVVPKLKFLFWAS